MCLCVFFNKSFIKNEILKLTSGFLSWKLFDWFIIEFRWFGWDGGFCFCCAKNCDWFEREMSAKPVGGEHIGDDIDGRFWWKSYAGAGGADGVKILFWRLFWSCTDFFKRKKF